MADMSKQLPREVEDALLEEACRQWYAFIQEDADRSDGVGFAHFCRTLSEQLLNDKDFMENYQTGFNLPGIRFCDSHYNTLFEIPDGGNVVITHFDGRQEILPCHYIDDSRMKVGETVFASWSLPKSKSATAASTRRSIPHGMTSAIPIPSIRS